MPDTPLDIPNKAPSVQARLSETHVRAEITPNDPHFAYDLLVPKGWAYSSELGPVTHMLLQAESLGFFAAAADSGAPVIAVTRTPCPIEVPLDGWARLTLAREGWNVVATQWFPGPNGVFFDATATRLVDDVEHVRRTSVRVARGSLIAVNCMCGRASWDAVKETFWAAHVTFAMLDPGEPNLEHWLRAGTTQPAFHTVHPQSWEAEPAQVPADVTDRSGLHLRLLDTQAHTLLAYLVVRAERNPFPQGPPPTAELVRSATTMIESSGVALTSAPKPLARRDDIRAAAVAGWIGGFAATATMGSAEIDVRLDFVELSPLVFTLVLCSPKLADDALVALRAQRAFEIVRAGIELDD